MKKTVKYLKIAMIIFFLFGDILFFFYPLFKEQFDGLSNIEDPTISKKIFIIISVVFLISILIFIFFITILFKYNKPRKDSIKKLGLGYGDDAKENLTNDIKRIKNGDYKRLVIILILGITALIFVASLV